jgi:hypothetical protein
MPRSRMSIAALSTMRARAGDARRSPVTTVFSFGDDMPAS